MLLLLLLALATQCTVLEALDAHSPIDEPLSPTPGTRERCNKLEVCLPYKDRIQYSYDFLCCEDNYGWPAAHVLNPLGASIFFGNFWYAWLAAFLFEAFEIGTLTHFESFVIFETAQLELETWTGSVWGDAFVQGAIGSLIGLLLRWLYAVSGPYQAWLHLTVWQRLKWLGLWFLYALSFVSLSYAGDAGNGNTLNYGLFIALGIQTVLLLAVYPLLTRSESDTRNVWQLYKEVAYVDRCGQKAVSYVSVGPVPFWRRYALFATWWVINIAIGLQSTGFWKWQPNDWYQVWFVSAIVLALLAAASFVRPAFAKRRLPTVLKVVTTTCSKRRVHKLID